MKKAGYTDRGYGGKSSNFSGHPIPYYQSSGLTDRESRL